MSVGSLKVRREAMKKKERKGLHTCRTQTASNFRGAPWKLAFRSVKLLENMAPYPPDIAERRARRTGRKEQAAQVLRCPRNFGIWFS